MRFVKPVDLISQHFPAFPTPEQYRAHYLDADRIQWRFALVLFAVPVAVFAWFDYALFGLSSTFYAFAALRVVLLGYSAWLWAYLPRVTVATLADRWLLLWGVLGILVMFINAIGRPTEYYGHYVFEVFALLMFYAALPMPPNKQLALTLFYLPIALAILFFYKTPPLAIYTGTVAFVPVLSVASGFLISRRIDRYRMAAFAAQLHLEHQAQTDPLTGIANRRAFMEWAANEVARQDRSNQPLALMMLDIDKFKRVNDEHGHAAGDAILVEMTRRIGSALRRYDHFARLGGEEFAIALPDTDWVQARAIAARILELVSRDPYDVPNQKIALTISIGLTPMHSGELALDSALNRADAALYAAKQGGRNRVEVLA